MPTINLYASDQERQVNNVSWGYSVVKFDEIAIRLSLLMVMLMSPTYISRSNSLDGAQEFGIS